MLGSHPVFFTEKGEGKMPVHPSGDISQHDTKYPIVTRKLSYGNVSMKLSFSVTV